jgi:hypothetical protein
MLYFLDHPKVGFSHCKLYGSAPRRRISGLPASGYVGGANMVSSQEFTKKHKTRKIKKPIKEFKIAQQGKFTN